MRFVFTGVLALACLSGYVYSHVMVEKIPPNRCVPGQGCFPTRYHVKSFADTLQGNVYLPSDKEYSGLVRNENSQQTSHPAMVVVAREVSDVQKAILFARHHQLMITSQTSNDDPSGRSSYDGSVNINLSQLEAISASPTNTSRSPYGEVTAQAGAVWENVYQAARIYSRDIVAPNRLKSAVGDTVGDGGVGPLVRIYGLVEDNLLEVEMVTADGSLMKVTENMIRQTFEKSLVRESYDRDLFAAIAGGGRGPWGIVTSYTFKMFPAPSSIVHAHLVYNLWEKGDYIGENVLEEVLKAVPAVPDKWGGHFYILGDTSNQQPDTKGTLVIDLVYYGTWKQDTDYNFIDNIVKIESSMSLRSSMIVNKTSILEHQRSQTDQYVNGRSYGFSMLLQNNGTANEEKKLTKALLFALNSPTIDSEYQCTGQLLGGAAATDPRLVSMTNPNLRSASVNLYCSLKFPAREVAHSYYISHALDFRRLLSPFSNGKHRYWAEDNVTGWKKSFHGDVYGKLIQTKLRYDVDNNLWCHNCVGSDFQIGCMFKGTERNQDGLLMGSMLAGYVNGNRFMEIKRRQEEESNHWARKVYVNQV